MTYGLIMPHFQLSVVDTDFLVQYSICTPSSLLRSLTLSRTDFLIIERDGFENAFFLQRIPYDEFLTQRRFGRSNKSSKCRPSGGLVELPRLDYRWQNRTSFNANE